MFVLLEGGDLNRLPSSTYLYDPALDATYTVYSAFHKYAESRKKNIVYLITNQDPIRGDMT
jgi:hypothetical protein